MTALTFSSALATDPRLTTPRAARLSVHLSNFISSSDVLMVIFFPVQLCIEKGKTGLPSHQDPVHLRGFIGKRVNFDNKFFCEIKRVLTKGVVLSYLLAMQ